MGDIKIRQGQNHSVKRHDIPKTEVNKELATEDRVTISSDNQPRIIVGAPTGRLSPYIDAPVPEKVTPVGIEIARGIGIGVDGQSIIVAPYAANEEINIIGHLPDGSYVQRDFKVTREDQGNTTIVKSAYDWQNYEIHKKENKHIIIGETDRDTFFVEDKGSQIAVDGKFPVQKYNITKSDKESVIDGFEDYDFKLIRGTDSEGNKVINIQTSYEDTNLTLTFKKDRVSLKGKLLPQNYDVFPTPEGLEFKGYYPHQKFSVKFKPVPKE